MYALQEKYVKCVPLKCQRQKGEITNHLSDHKRHLHIWCAKVMFCRVGPWRNQVEKVLCECFP